MKTISFLIPCCNEKNSISPVVDLLVEIMSRYEGRYNYEIIFRDNASTDGSLGILRELASNNKRIKVIVNARNYGNDYRKETLVGRVHGDIAIFIAGDLQELLGLIPEYIAWYEKGYEVVCGEIVASENGRIKKYFRKAFFNFMDLFYDQRQYHNLSGSFLLSRRLLDIYWTYNWYPAFCYFMSDLGCEVKRIQYIQRKHTQGDALFDSFNPSNTLFSSIGALIDTSLKPLRLATIMGLLMSLLSFMVSIVYLVFKLFYWERFPAGITPILLGILFVGSILLLFMGMLGEYVGNILYRVKQHIPPVISELINFDDSNDPFLIHSVKAED